METPAKSREESISELQGKINEIEGRISANRKELEGAEEKLKEARRQLELIEPLEKEAREKRQGLLADGKEIKEATKTFRDICEKRELLEEQIGGLEKKLLNLGQEAERLPGEKRQNEMDLLGLMLIPLISKYNLIAEKMAKILEELYGVTWKLDDPRRFVFSSDHSWEGSLELIPRLYFLPEYEPNIPTGHVFNRRVSFCEYVRKAEQERVDHAKKVEQEIEGK
jgi:chromosome segregation ATPase